MIDEIQLAPELPRPIKVVVGTNPQGTCRFLLTGPARVLALRDLPDASRASSTSLRFSDPYDQPSGAPPTGRSASL